MVPSYETMGDWLEEIAQQFPDAFFEELDGGIQLEEQAREAKQAALGADKDLAQFEGLFDQTKETVNRMHGILLKVRSRDEDAAGRLSKALAALAEAVRRCAE